MSRDVHIITNQNDNQRASYSLLLWESSQKSFNREMLGSDCFFFLEGVCCFGTRPLPRDHGRQRVCLICGTPLCHQWSSSHTNGSFTCSCLSQLLLALLSAIIQVLMSSRFSSGSQKAVLWWNHGCRGAAAVSPFGEAKPEERLPRVVSYFPAEASLAASTKIRCCGTPGWSSLSLPPGAPHGRSIVTTAFLSSFRPEILCFCGGRTQPQSAEVFLYRLMVGEQHDERWFQRRSTVCRERVDLVANAPPPSSDTLAALHSIGLVIGGHGGSAASSAGLGVRSQTKELWLSLQVTPECSLSHGPDS